MRQISCAICGRSKEAAFALSKTKGAAWIVPTLRKKARCLLSWLYCTVRLRALRTNENEASHDWAGQLIGLRFEIRWAVRDDHWSGGASVIFVNLKKKIPPKVWIL